MWLDSTLEKGWADLFKYSGTPKLVVLNPGKRKRYVEHEGEFTYNSLKETLEKIVAGDAKFIRITEETLPELSFRKE